MATLISTTASASNTRLETPIWWPLRAWMGVEVMFGLAAILTIFLRPQDTATNFAWPIKPDVMAATLGAFYISTASTLILALFARTWQNVRTVIIPATVFTTMLLLATFIHWDKFSLGTIPFYVWFASYLLPPPIFAALYWWHQKQAAPVGTHVTQPLAGWIRGCLRTNGLLLAGLALLLFVVPALLQQIGPWTFTPLTARTLGGWLMAVGLLQAWMGWEGDWQRVKLGTAMLIALPLTLFFQLFRFSAEVQWANIALWVLLVDMLMVAVLMLYLWVTAGGSSAPA